MPKKKEILNPRLNTDTVLWWLQPTPEMGLASGFETYLTAYCSYQTKRKQKMKNIKTKVIRAYAEVPEGETEVWAICTAPLLGTRKQTSTEWSARNSPPSWDRRIWADCVRFESSRGTQIIMFFVLLSYLRTVPFTFWYPTCSLGGKCLLLKHHPRAEKEEILM